MIVPVDHLPSYLGVDQPDGSYAIVHVLGVLSVSPGGDAAHAAEEKALTDRIANAEQSEYIEALRQRFDARITRADLSAAGKGGPAKP
jgi:hypothetical protein